MSLNVFAWGERGAPPLLALHGVTSHGGRFGMLAERGLANRYRILSPDLRGHGRSSWEPPWSIAQHVADVLELAPARSVWMGHSFGGRLVAEVARQAPDRVERAIMLDPAFAVDAAIALEKAELERTDASYESPDEAIAERLASGLLFSTPRAILEREMEEHLVRGEDGRLRYRYCKSAVIAAWGEMATEPPPPPNVPTLVLLGAESWLRLPEAWAGHGEVITVPGGHSLLWDALEETAAAIDRFLS
jgi:lipase